MDNENQPPEVPPAAATAGPTAGPTTLEAEPAPACPSPTPNVIVNVFGSLTQSSRNVLSQILGQNVAEGGRQSGAGGVGPVRGGVGPAASGLPWERPAGLAGHGARQGRGRPTRAQTLLRQLEALGYQPQAPQPQAPQPQAPQPQAPQLQAPPLQAPQLQPSSASASFLRRAQQPGNVPAPVAAPVRAPVPASPAGAAALDPGSGPSCKVCRIDSELGVLLCGHYLCDPCYTRVAGTRCPVPWCLRDLTGNKESHFITLRM